MPAIDAALSIGPNCRAAYHLRRVYGIGCARGVFDWQVTPLEAIHAYIDRNFRGMFERSDLEVRDGVVWNARFGTSHMHEFPANLAPENLDEHYVKARARHDHLARRLRRSLKGKSRLLLVYSGPITTQELATLEARLRAYAPKLRFYLIAQTRECADGSKGAPKDAWKGDPAAWDRLLSPYRIGLLRQFLLHLRRRRKAGKGRKRVP